MKLLLESWRTYLKESEGNGVHPKIMQIIDGLANEDGHVLILGKVNPMARMVRIVLKADGGSTNIAEITINKPEPPCMVDHNIWVVEEAKTERWAKKLGFGPLMYEIAIELASLNDGGLAPDRVYVTSDARDVWQKYFERPDLNTRHIDVDFKSTSGANFPPPNPIKQVTPNDQGDDCDVTSSFRVDGPMPKTSLDQIEGTKWSEDPVGYLYYKNSTPTLDYLAEEGMLRGL